MVEIIEINTADKNQVKIFLDLPFRLYAEYPQWVPPLAMDAHQMLDRQRNPFYLHSQAVFYLALNNDRAVGRLAILDNHNYNSYNQERTAGRRSGN